MSDISLINRQNLDTRALLLSALAAIFWGTNFEATRIVLTEMPPWTAAALRFEMAAVAAVLWLALTHGLNFAVLRRNAVAFVILGLVGVSGFNAALFLGMETSSPVTAALIMGTSPLTTNLLDALINRRRPAGIALIGMGISLIGVALTVGAFSGARFATGDLMIAGGSLAWALYSIGCRRRVAGATPLETTVWTMIFGAAALVVIAFATESPMRLMAEATPVFWLASLHMALIGSAGLRVLAGRHRTAWPGGDLCAVQPRAGLGAGGGGRVRTDAGLVAGAGRCRGDLRRLARQQAEGRNCSSGAQNAICVIRLS